MNNEQPGQQFTPGQPSSPTPPTQIPPSIATHNDKNIFKLLFLTLTPAVLILGLVGGIVLGRTVLKEKSFEDKFYEQFYNETYGTEGESIVDFNSEDVQKRARDTERRTDINSVATQLEAYYADFGHYPSGSVTTDTCGQKTGVTYSGDCALAVLTTRGLDVEALRSPNGGVQINVVSSTPTPADGEYYYFPSLCNNERCEAYTLFSDLEYESTDYSKESLN